MLLPNVFGLEKKYESANSHRNAHTPIHFAHTLLNSCTPHQVMSSQLNRDTLDAVFKQMGVLSILPPNFSHMPFTTKQGLFTTCYAGINEVWKCQAEIAPWEGMITIKSMPAPTTAELFASTQIASKLPSDRDYFVRLEFAAGERVLLLPCDTRSACQNLLVLKLTQGDEIELPLAQPVP